MVTGAAGLIGSHLIEKLIEQKHFVFGFDTVNIETCKNLENVKNHKNFQYFRGVFNEFSPIKTLW